MSCAAILPACAQAKRLMPLHMLKRLQGSYCATQCARTFRASSKSISHAAIAMVWSEWLTLDLCLQSKNYRHRRLQQQQLKIVAKRLEDLRFILAADWELPLL